MAKKRGLVAEIIHQRELAAREAEKQAKAAERERKRAEREQERQMRALDREMQAAHVEAQKAEAEFRNSELVKSRSQMEQILHAGLSQQIEVDLESLRQRPQHPPFPHPELTLPAPVQANLAPPRPEPVLNDPTATGIGLLRGKRGQAKLQEKAQARFEEDHARWREEASRYHADVEAAEEEQAKLETARLAKLKAAEEKFAAECAERESLVDAQNAELDELISGLAFGLGDAVDAYLQMVLAESRYPEDFPVSHEVSFDQPSGELALMVFVPDPRELDMAKSYRYVKASDEIASTALSQKAQRELFADAVVNTALRSVHEVFAASQAGVVQTVACQVGAETLSPATGVQEFVPLLAVSASREVFLSFNLAAVEPMATMQHLGASVSKNMIALSPADTRGVRAA